MLKELKQELDRQYFEMYPEKKPVKKWEKRVYWTFMGLAVSYFGAHYIVYLIHLHSGLIK